MKWKKGESKTGAYGDATKVTEYNTRPLRVPRPPMSKSSNLIQTYDWLMNKHDNGEGTNDQMFN